jgi:hypothetical protein
MPKNAGADLRLKGGKMASLAEESGDEAVEEPLAAADSRTHGIKVWVVDEKRVGKTERHACVVRPLARLQAEAVEACAHDFFAGAMIAV